MNHIFKSGTYTWWQVGILKLSLLLIGISIGAYWPVVFRDWLTSMIIVAAICGIYTMVVWIRQS